VAPGEAARAAAAGAVKFKDPTRSPSLVVILDRIHKGWRKQVGQTIERKVVSKQKKNLDRMEGTSRKTNT